MKKIAVLIPDGENEHVLWTVRSLVDSHQVQVHILSDRPLMPIRFSRHCSLYEYRRTGEDYEARLDALADITRRHSIDVILPVSEEGVLFASSERARLSALAALPPLPKAKSLRIAKNKWLLNQFACEHDIRVPDAALVTLTPAFEREISALQYPVLLKPTCKTDGQGIRRFNSHSDLTAYLETQDADEIRNQYLVQTFIPGYDVGFSMLCQDGKIFAYTMQQGIISAAHRFGPLMAMQFIHRDDVLNMGCALSAALDWGGVAHVDFRHDAQDGQPKIVEVNARYWGSLLGSLTAGVNFPYLACLAALGIPFERPKYRLSKYAHTTTAIKEGVLSLVGKNEVPGLDLWDTGLRFCLPDPVPEVVKRLQESHIL